MTNKIAGMQIILSGRDIKFNFSFNKATHNTIQLAHKLWTIHCLELFFADQNTAKKAIPINNISMIDHQVGASAQQVAEQVCAIKTNGVAAQWKRQIPLANAPMVSEFDGFKDFEIIYH